MAEEEQTENSLDESEYYSKAKAVMNLVEPEQARTPSMVTIYALLAICDELRGIRTRLNKDGRRRSY